MAKIQPELRRALCFIVVPFVGGLWLAATTAVWLFAIAGWLVAFGYIIIRGT